MKLIQDTQLIIHKNVDLSLLHTFRLKSRTKQLIVVNNTKELLHAIQYAQQRSYTCRVFSIGSNVVFPFQGVDYLLIQILGGSFSSRGNRVIADAGVLLSTIVEHAILNGYSGLEYLSGIPGSIGGSVVGNAGAYGRTIADVLEGVEIWNGKIIQYINKDDCMFSYRESIFKNMPYIILRVMLRLRKANGEKLKKISLDILRERIKKYPPGLACPGSFFKNIEIKNLTSSQIRRIDTARIIVDKLPAGYLLDGVNARGLKIGDITVSKRHSNLLVNIGQGTSKEVITLASLLKDRVKKKFGIALEEEIRYF